MGITNLEQLFTGPGNFPAILLNSAIIVRRFFNRQLGFLHSLPPGVRLAFYALLLLQLVAYTFFAFEIQLQYDEWHSWHFFSNVSFETIFTWYPAPNNHVFYNLVARCFLLTGLDPEIAVRVPSIIASMLTTYFFFRLLCRYLPSWLGLVMVALLVSEFYFVYYSFSARGYSFVYLFCVLLLYASGPLSERYEGRYRVIFVLTQVLGLFTVLSFLYVLVVPGLLVFIYVIGQRSRASILRFLGDYALIVVLTIVSYSGILFLGDPTHFLNPESWTEKFDIHDPKWLDNLVYFLDTKFFELFGFYKLKTAAVSVLILVIIQIWKRESGRLFMVITCAAMFYFPFVIVLAHKIYPFGRSLYYIIVPSLLLLGFAVDEIRQVFSRFSRLKVAPWIINCFLFLCVLACLFLYVKYPSRHRSGWDYEMNLMRKTRMKDVIKNMDGIGRTNVGFEYYIQDLLIHYVHRDHPDVQLSLAVIDSVKNEDVLIIHHSELEKLRPQLINYSFLFSYNDISLFVSDSISSRH